MLYLLLIYLFQMELNKEDLRREGIVLEALPGIHFRVKLDEGEEILAHLAGKLRIHRIKVLPGDRVTVEVSGYDDGRGRIIYRGKYHQRKR